MAKKKKKTVFINGEEVEASTKVKLWDNKKKTLNRRQVREMIVAKREETRKAEEDAGSGS